VSQRPACPSAPQTPDSAENSHPPESQIGPAPYSIMPNPSPQKHLLAPSLPHRKTPPMQAPPSPGPPPTHTPPHSSRTAHLPNGKHTHLLRLLPPHPPLDLPQTLAHKQNPINQQPVRRPLDLEIPEKRIRAKQREHFVERVVRFAVGVDVQV